MAKTRDPKEHQSLEQLLAELTALPQGSLSGEKWLEYVRRLPKPDLPEGWTSADDIREMRGPLPEEGALAVPEGISDRTADEQEAVRSVLRDLQALPPGYMLTRDELLGFLQRMPQRPDDFTSADIIRELRGPLPEDDPEFQRNILGRR